MYTDRASAAPRGRCLYLCLDLATVPDRDAAPSHLDVHYRPTLTSGSGMYEVVSSSDPKAMFTLLHLKVKPMSARAIEVAANPAVRPILWRLTNDLVICRKNIRVNGSTNEDVVIFYTRGEDCSPACTDCQLSSRPASQEPVNVPSRDEMPPLSVVKPSFSCTPAKRPRAFSQTLSPLKPSVFSSFKSAAAAKSSSSLDAFSPRTQVHCYVGLLVSLPVHELSAVCQALREVETCVNILRSRVAALESLEDVDF
ncbi:hypothetical protein AJ78_04282 [Emergomyces pasteurianus Ep9510]|uniref:Uncharacterized protein n=1 Tax=Emergomyces pasteurianus Ep9510 TaxID=1447872 RepID=A0A1J9PGC2_9EURO|nr:hypothetical protein AJ78_04282 [Emergomyces pasteurianus Ep9510]